MFWHKIERVIRDRSSSKAETYFTKLTWKCWKKKRFLNVSVQLDYFEFLGIMYSFSMTTCFNCSVRIRCYILQLKKNICSESQMSLHQHTINRSRALLIVSFHGNQTPLRHKIATINASEM